MFEDKYQMSQEQNILWAKRNLVDSIYHSIQLEGLNLTFPETYGIIEKAKMQEVDIADVSTVLNLKHAWQFILTHLENKIDLDFIKAVHNEVAKDEALSWGKLRTGNVGISGTDYVPPIPSETQVLKKLEYFENQNNITERAINRMLWMMKSQLFWDGNKRTATLIANKDLIQHGRGILTIKSGDLVEFNTLLSDFYTDDAGLSAIQNFIYEKALNGIPELNKEKDFDNDFER